MFSLSSPPLALERKLKLTTTYTILLVFFLFTLHITSCEARRLRVNGKYSSSNKSSLSSQDATEVADAQKQRRNSLMVHDTEKKARAVGSSIDQSTGAGATLINRSGDSSRGSNGEQLGSKATTVYTAGTLVTMDYPVAHAAPAVHNR
ncbi:uncharacterized protein LOC123404792 [Hordeum vulgare subsp. vulgare]|uniref:Uncharacterized protein n=1 Tax=Hordeum vulgare subsp. vulgare TaxID=112509 RepID=A0A8I6Y3A1_HORVV|nr:uncharacterized protein LOC123404792 [Hordeum vulgare subsp. vulgare]KAI4980976.1 hypothetical protein ZWY2020_021461 [Hordeum vulgare]